MGVSHFAAAFQPNNSLFHHHATHPSAWAASLGGMFQMIGCCLASADTATSPFPGPVPNAAAPSLAAHLHECQRTAIRLRRGLHHRSYEGLQALPCAASTIADTELLIVVIDGHLLRDGRMCPVPKTSL
jgi:hypothetical protein